MFLEGNGETDKPDFSPSQKRRLKFPPPISLEAPSFPSSSRSSEISGAPGSPEVPGAPGSPDDMICDDLIESQKMKISEPKPKFQRGREQVNKGHKGLKVDHQGHLRLQGDPENPGEKVGEETRDKEGGERTSQDDSGIGCGTSLEILSVLGAGHCPDSPLETEPPCSELLPIRVIPCQETPQLVDIICNSQEFSSEPGTTDSVT